MLACFTLTTFKKKKNSLKKKKYERNDSGIQKGTVSKNKGKTNLHIIIEHYESSIQDTSQFKKKKNANESKTKEHSWIKAIDSNKNCKNEKLKNISSFLLEALVGRITGTPGTVDTAYVVSTCGLDPPPSPRSYSAERA